jgi:two-component system phosphate regulon response regulator PhoB
MTAKILLLEDEQPIREMLRFSLETKGYTVIEAESARQAREILLTNHPNIIIVDWMMPEESGIEFIKKLKNNEIFCKIPTMILTARLEEMDKVKGLDSGADDYITKPVAISEFQSRIKMLLRRSTVAIEFQYIDILGIKLHLDSHQLSIDGQLVAVGSAEFKLLKFFLVNKNKVYSRKQLLDFVWGQDVYLEERTIDVNILRLRKILKPFNKQSHFITVRGMGYMFTDGSIY